MPQIIPFMLSSVLIFSYGFHQSQWPLLRTLQTLSPVLPPNIQAEPEILETSKFGKPDANYIKVLKKIK